MGQALNKFLDWFVRAKLKRLALTMKEELQRVFPEKSGEKSAQPWNFPKAYAPDHTGSKVLANGTAAYTETQVFETGHKPNVKKLTDLTNRND